MTTPASTPKSVAALLDDWEDRRSPGQAPIGWSLERHNRLYLHDFEVRELFL